jgi:hypothetical protein
MMVATMDYPEMALALDSLMEFKSPAEIVNDLLDEVEMRRQLAISRQEAKEGKGWPVRQMVEDIRQELENG